MDEVVKAISTVGFPIVMALLIWYQQFRFSGQLLASEERESIILTQITTNLARVDDAIGKMSELLGELRKPH